MRKLFIFLLLIFFTGGAFAVTSDISIEGNLTGYSSVEFYGDLKIGSFESEGYKLRVYGGGFGISTDNSTDINPTIGSFIDLSAGEYCRFQFGDSSNAFQNGYGQALDIYSYHTLRLMGDRNVIGSPAYSTESNIGVHVINTTAASPALVVDGAAAQSASLQQWRDNAGNLLSVVDMKGGLGIGTPEPTASIEVYGKIKLNNINGVPLSIIPSASTPTGANYGELFMDSSGKLFYYDSTRAKWLSVETMAFGWGSASADGAALAFGAAVSTAAGAKMPYAGTIVAIGAQASGGFATKQFDIYINNATSNNFSLASLAYSSTSTNINFNAGDYLSVFANAASAASTNPCVVLYVKWRK